MARSLAWNIRAHSRETCISSHLLHVISCNYSTTFAFVLFLLFSAQFTSSATTRNHTLERIIRYHLLPCFQHLTRILMILALHTPSYPLIPSPTPLLPKSLSTLISTLSSIPRNILLSQAPNSQQYNCCPKSIPMLFLSPRATITASHNLGLHIQSQL